MSSKSILVLATVVLTLGLAAGKSAQSLSSGQWWANGTPDFAYDCNGKEDGNYPHPTKCTHYVACVAQTYAYEMQCALNQDGRPLHYVASSGPDPRTSKCDYPEVAGCEQNATTLAPTTQPEIRTTQLPDAPTTQAPEVPSTQAPPADQCQDHDCRQDGDCNSFQVCRKGQWEKKQCGQDLFWNPEIENGFGGACDYYNNLSNKVKEQYINDPDCIPPCEWWQLDEERCSGTFHYRAPFDTETLLGRESTLTCPTAPSGSKGEDLIWNPDTLTCDRSANVNGCGTTA